LKGFVLKHLNCSADTHQISHANADSQHDTVSKTKRSLLKASWIPPVILAIGLPRSGYASNISGGDTTEKQHQDNGNHFGQFK
jgi:hypothetical protein